MEYEGSDEQDHKAVGRRLGIYANDPMLGSGLPMWLPAGAVVRSQLEDYIREAERRAGYAHVYTPPLGKRELYAISGHLEHFADDMFPAIEIDGEDLMLRPMLCPHHIRVFASAERSYRDLPCRIAELGAQFRWERSGVVGGLARVRCMTLNDAHIFCAPAQIEEELAAVLEMIERAYRWLGITPHRYRLSLRGSGVKYADDDEMWHQAEGVLRSALESAGVPYEAASAEAAFYGPKLDVQVIDHRGREETLSTMQVDFLLPRRFGISYIASGGERRTPVLLHRSIISTMERMVAHLLDVHGGDLPVWLAPVQVTVIPVSDSVVGYARSVVERLAEHRLRAAVDASAETVALRVRRALERKIPYVVIVGEREVAGGTLAVRARGEDKPRSVTTDDLVATIHSQSPRT